MLRIPTEDPYMIGCMGGHSWGDEDKFNHLHNFSGGMGDRTWWVESEVLKLNSADRRLLHFMLKRNTWVRDHILTMDVVNYVSKLIGCETYHIYRMGLRPGYELVRSFVKRYDLFRKSGFSQLPDASELNLLTFTSISMKSFKYNEPKADRPDTTVFESCDCGAYGGGRHCKGDSECLYDAN
jgi:hypothetical protein